MPPKSLGGVVLVALPSARRTQLTLPPPPLKRPLGGVRRTQLTLPPPPQKRPPGGVMQLQSPLVNPPRVLRRSLPSHRFKRSDDENDDDDRRGAAPEEEEGGKGGRPGTTTTTTTGVPEYVLTDEFSREAYDRIMRQYTEARHYARAAGGRTNPVVRRQARRRRRRPFQPERRRCWRRRWRRHLVRRVLRRERLLGRLLLLDRGRWGGRGGGRTSEGRGGRWSPRHDDSGGGSDYGDD